MTRLTALIGTFCAALLMLQVVVAAQPRGATPARGTAQPPTRGADVQGDPDEIIIRSYDIADLVRTNTNYPSDTVTPRPPTMNRPDGSVQPPPPPRSSSTIEPDALIELIQSTVGSDTWRDTGGSVGAIRSLGTILVVQQTRRAQNQIHQLLDGLREILGPMQVMTVHATWVLA